MQVTIEWFVCLFYFFFFFFFFMFSMFDDTNLQHVPKPLINILFHLLSKFGRIEILGDEEKNHMCCCSTCTTEQTANQL